MFEKTAALNNIRARIDVTSQQQALQKLQHSSVPRPIHSHQTGDLVHVLLVPCGSVFNLIVVQTLFKAYDDYFIVFLSLS